MNSTIGLLDLCAYTTGDLNGYIEFFVLVDGCRIESLFRIYDPLNGPSLDLVTVDYGYCHLSVAEYWSEIEKACCLYAKITVPELYQQGFDHKKLLLEGTNIG